MDDEGAHRPRVAVNVSAGQEMAGFAVSINGRFWVSTEAGADCRSVRAFANTQRRVL